MSPFYHMWPVNTTPFMHRIRNFIVTFMALTNIVTDGVYSPQTLLDKALLGYATFRRTKHHS